MGRKGGGWFSAVKKVFVSDSKKDQKQQPQQQPQHHNNRSRFACFGVHHEGDMENAPEGAPIAVVPSLPRRQQIKPIKTGNEQSKQAFSLVLATAVAAGAAVAAASAEVARLTNTPRSNAKMNKEVAAIKIQTAYRGYSARRTLRGLRGLARLKTLVQGQSVQRQAATTLQCMQTLSRLQSQVRARKVRMSEENQALQRQQQQKREKEFDRLQANIGEKWDDSSKSKEQVEAKLLQRQIAAMRREKALAYASTHQQTWRNSSKSTTNATFMDPNNPHWGWNWLERWMAARPWEGQNTTYHNVHASSTKVAASRTMSVGEITKLYSLRDEIHDVKNTQPNQKSVTRPHNSHNSPSTIAPKASSSNGITKAKVSLSSSSPSNGSWGSDVDLKNTFNKTSENNRRHSIGVSPESDNESHSSSSSAFHSHTTTPSTKVAMAKPSSTKVRSASFGVHKNGTPEKAASTPLKKRLSFPASPVGTRRNSVPTRPENVVSSKVATIPDGKVKVKNGGNR